LSLTHTNTERKREERKRESEREPKTAEIVLDSAVNHNKKHQEKGSQKHGRPTKTTRTSSPDPRNLRPTTRHSPEPTEIADTKPTLKRETEDYRRLQTDENRNQNAQQSYASA